VAEDDVSVGLYDDSWCHADSLKMYQACAQEFHFSGKVRLAAQPIAYRHWTVRMSAILLALVFCASFATGVTPLCILSLSASAELDSIALQLALEVSNTVTNHLSQMTVVALNMVNQTSDLIAGGVLSADLNGGFHSEPCLRMSRYLYAVLNYYNTANVEYHYIGTEYSATILLQLVNSSRSMLFNRTLPELLAKYPGGPVPPSGSLGVPDMDCYPYNGGDTLGPLYTTRPTFDPRTRPWYIKAKNGGPNFRGWTAPYLFPAGGLGVTAAKPAYNASGDFVGVVAADITLVSLVAFLNSPQMSLTPHMRHTVLEMNGYIIGSSVPGVVSSAMVNGTMVRVPVFAPSQPPELLQALRILQNGQTGYNLTTNGSVLKLENQYYYATIMRDSYNLQWLYIMYVPVDDFLGAADSATAFAVGLCIGLVAFIMAVALFAVWRFGLQLRRLTEDMRRATALQLDDIRSGKDGSFVSEIRDICVELDKLTTALKSLQKYLPQDQVAFLLSSNLQATLACVEQEITVFFLDIKNFTSVVECLSDRDLLKFYGDVMTILTERITDEQGVLDKYIGDAVMAFWNMPRAVADHETKAVKAALACRAAIPELADKGWHIDFRIGINTASCQVGNFGSWDRLNYTVIGDGVNVACRLEALCKTYVCPILVSGATHKKLTRNTFATRLVDIVTAERKDTAIALYEVVGYRGDVSPGAAKQLAEYERAFSQYCDGSYLVAQQGWRQLAALGDLTAQMMADRLDKGGRPTVAGVWKWETK